MSSSEQQQQQSVSQDAAAESSGSEETLLLIDPLPSSAELESLPSTRLRELLQQRQKQQGIWEGDLASSMATLQTQKNVGMRETLVDPEGFPRDDIDVTAVRAARNIVATRTNDLKKLGDEMKLLLEATFAALAREQENKNSNQDAAAAAVTIEEIERRNMKMFEERRNKKKQKEEQGTDADVNRTMKMIQQERQDKMNKIWSEAGVLPICVVRDVAPNSPAFLASLLDGDTIVAIGEDTGTENLLPQETIQMEDTVQPMMTLAEFASVIKNCEGKSLRVIVERKSETTSKTKTTSTDNNSNKDYIELHLVPKRWSGNGILGCGLDPV